ncbi:uncharacterized protein LOC120667764 [Panicum virgatum]|uniref:uncharacterized protein LOC120667764 n=1 Tax=Panicum virgatum TaxID=38727 RepID=UPI0019D5D0CE|nr:uncharacterized protein LOC120667764 [Panicum virgatum]
MGRKLSRRRGKKYSLVTHASILFLSRVHPDSIPFFRRATPCTPPPPRIRVSLVPPPTFLWPGTSVVGSPRPGAAAASSWLPRAQRRRRCLAAPLGRAPPQPVHGSPGTGGATTGSSLPWAGVAAAAVGSRLPGSGAASSPPWRHLRCRFPLTVTPKRLCPILEVSLDFVKSLYAKFIDWDEDMYDLENDTPAHAAKLK